MYYDPMYFLFMIPGFIIALIAQGYLKSNYSKYSKIVNRRNLTGAMAAKAVLNQNGINDVRIECIDGTLSDHYDPRSNVIRLSRDVYESASIAAVGIAAHEAGHAVQHAQNYAPVKIRTAMVPICNIGSQLGIILIFVGFVIDFLELTTLGIILFSLTVVFQLVTLPVEFNASRRALNAIQSGQLLCDGDEYRGAKRVLTSAALTYVAALVTAILQLLYYISKADRRRN